MRKRIPQQLRDVCPRTRTEGLRSQRTSGAELAKLRLRAELVLLDQQFERMRVELDGT